MLKWAAILGLACALGAQETPVKSLSKAEIEQIVHDYLLKNPEVLIESVRQYQTREQTAKKQASKNAIVARKAELVSDPFSPATRPAAAAANDVTIVAFLDYRCGYCKRANPTLNEVIAKNPNVRVVYKELPILGPDSTMAAKAALAANKQGKYLPFHQALWKVAAVNQASVDQVAREQGLDLTRLKADMASPEIEAALHKNLALAEELGIQATPTFVVGGELAEGAIDAKAFESLIAQAAKKP